MCGRLSKLESGRVKAYIDRTPNYSVVLLLLFMLYWFFLEIHFCFVASFSKIFSTSCPKPSFSIRFSGNELYVRSINVPVRIVWWKVDCEVCVRVSEWLWIHRCCALAKRPFDALTNTKWHCTLAKTFQTYMSVCLVGWLAAAPKQHSAFILTHSHIISVGKWDKMLS